MVGVCLIDLLIQLRYLEFYTPNAAFTKYKWLFSGYLPASDISLLQKISIFTSAYSIDYSAITIWDTLLALMYNNSHSQSNQGLFLSKKRV
jgi:hypothetical protein